jgi:glycosyltransferase involved in cell wall biosynthesis
MKEVMQLSACRWAINGRFLTQRTTGVQRYARGILGALDAILDARRGQPDQPLVELLVPPETIPPALATIAVRRVGRLHGHLWEQFSLPAHIRGEGLISLANTGPLAIRKQIVCVHDVNTRAVPTSYSRSFRLAYRLLQPALGRIAAQVTTVSTYSAQQLAKHGVAAPDKISIAPDGHEHVRGWRRQHSARTNAAAGPDTIVVLGSVTRHKNIELLINLAEALRALNFRLAIVGLQDGTVFNRSSPYTACDNVSWLGHCSDDELAALLDDCHCLALPSIVEGFGLPALEAMALGCPVIVSDRSSLPEVCGDAAIYASPFEPDRWISAFLKLRQQPGLREQLIAKGLARAPLFSWHQSASIYLDLMARLDKANVSVPAGRVAYSGWSEVSVEK